MVHDTRYDLRKDRYTDTRFKWLFSPWTGADPSRGLYRRSSSVRRARHGLAARRLFTPRPKFTGTPYYAAADPGAVDSAAQEEETKEEKTVEEHYYVPPRPTIRPIYSDDQEAALHKWEQAVAAFDQPHLQIYPATHEDVNTKRPENEDQYHGHPASRPLPQEASKYDQSQVVPQVRPEHRIHATFSAESYLDYRRPYVDGWIIVPQLSDKNFSVYRQGSAVIMAIRGTVLTEPADLGNDLLITLNVQKFLLPRVTRAEQRLQEILEEYPGIDKLQFTGHSLGGAVACELARMHASEAIVFNSAAPPTSPVRTRSPGIFAYHIVFDLISAWNINNRLIDKGYRPFDPLATGAIKIIDTLVGFFLPVVGTGLGLFAGSLEIGTAILGHSMENFFTWGPTHKRVVVSQGGYSASYGAYEPEGSRETTYRPPTPEELAKATNITDPLSNVHTTTEENQLWEIWSDGLTDESSKILHVAEISTGQGYNLPPIPGSFQTDGHGHALNNQYNQETDKEWKKLYPNPYQ